MVLYLGALCSGVLETLAEAEKAAIAAVAPPPGRGRRLLPLRTMAQRRREEDTEEMHLKAALSHKKAIDSSLRRILTAVSVNPSRTLLLLSFSFLKHSMAWSAATVHHQKAAYLFRLWQNGLLESSLLIFSASIVYCMVCGNCVGNYSAWDLFLASS